MFYDLNVHLHSSVPRQNFGKNQVGKVNPLRTFWPLTFWPFFILFHFLRHNPEWLCASLNETLVSLGLHVGRVYNEKAICRHRDDASSGYKSTKWNSIQPSFSNGLPETLVFPVLHVVQGLFELTVVLLRWKGDRGPGMGTVSDSAKTVL